jgi:hypothetical protein
MAVAARAPAWQVDVEAAVMPCRGESRAGDCVLVRTFRDALVVAVLDVAGHGSAAATVAEDIKRRAQTWEDAAPETWLRLLDHALKGSQGGVAAVARFDLVAGTLTLASVGNVQCTWFAQHAQRLSNSDGLLGVVMPTVRSLRVPLESGGRLVMLSDGVRSAANRILAERIFHSGTADLVRHVVDAHQRAHDDATCVIASANRLTQAQTSEVSA